MKKRVFSGIKPSGDLHLGNYIGALSQWVKNQHNYENLFCIVDLHALTVPIDTEKLHDQRYAIAAWYLAAGIDPETSTIFLQSDNPDHAYLGWLLNCYTSVGQLGRMTQYKDKKDKIDFVSVGLYDYPVLMAADILLYDADLVPVGDDQKQHIELTRDIADRMNGQYGDLFKLPAYMPPPTGERIMSLQNPMNKMSKSESDPNGTVNMADSADEIRRKLNIAVTDSGNEILVNDDKPAISNLATIYMALSDRTIEQLDEEYSGKGYKKFKDDLAELIISTLVPIQERYAAIRESGTVEKVLTLGAQSARTYSVPKIQQVRKAIGLG